MKTCKQQQSPELKTLFLVLMFSPVTSLLAYALLKYKVSATDSPLGGATSRIHRDPNF